jgi:hypothetical protein
MLIDCYIQDMRDFLGAGTVLGAELARVAGWRPVDQCAIAVQRQVRNGIQGWKDVAGSRDELDEQLTRAPRPA